MTIRFGPALLFSLYGGVLADRLRKRRTMIYCEALQLVIALTLAILMSADLLTVTIIWVLAGVRGVGEAVQGPIRQSFVPEMVGTEDLTNAIALNSTQFNAARIIGPAVGAIIVKAIGYAACFYINAASFIAVIGALLAMRVSELHLAPRLPREPVLEQVREGLRYARSQPDVVAILIVVGFIGAFGYNFMTLTPLITKEVLQQRRGHPGMAHHHHGRRLRACRAVHGLSRQADAAASAGAGGSVLDHVGGARRCPGGCRSRPC